MNPDPLDPADLAGISGATLANYERTADAFWQGTRGHDVSQDRVRSDLDWLQEQGLLTVRDIQDSRVATINGRGVDVSAGRTKLTGVKRPRPGG